MSYNIYASQSDAGPVPYTASVAMEPWPWNYSNPQATHIQGTGVSLGASSATVTATNGDTHFTSDVLPGDTYLFAPQQSTYYTVSSVTSDTQLILTTEWTGSAATGQIMYGPFNRPPRESELPSGILRILALMADATTGMPITLYEDYGLYANYTSGTWTPAEGWVAEGGVKFNLSTGAQRTDGWTSTMASGQPCMPFLIRYDELLTGNIAHPLRGEIGSGLGLTNNSVWPGTHSVGGGGSDYTLGYLPMGSRLRLNSGWWSANASSFSPLMQVIGTCVVDYGFYVTDQTSGLVFGIDAAPDSRWVRSDVLTLWNIPVSAFELVDTVKPSLTFTASAGPWTTGNPITFTVTYSYSGNSNFNTNLLPSWSADGGTTWSQTGMSGLYSYEGRELLILSSPSTYSGTFTWTPSTAGYYMVNLTGANASIAAISGLGNPYWIAPANLSISVSETTRHMTTTQAGRWDNPATWGGVAPPTYGDYATVTYPVLIVGPTTIGDGTGSTVLTISGSGAVTVIGATLTIRGLSTGSPLTAVNSAGVTAHINYV